MVKKKGIFACIKINALFAFLLISAFALVTAATALTAAADSHESPGIPVPIVMYHSILKNTASHGEYVISPDTLENDIRYLLERGYTPVFVQNLIDFVSSAEPLPEKPIILSFDDGHFNNYTYAFELAKKYDVRLVISPIVRFTDQFTESGEENANYSYLNWSRIREMSDSGLVEFQNHSYDLHTPGIGIKKQDGQSNEEYLSMLRDDLMYVQDKFEMSTGMRPTTFVYPFGACDKISMKAIRNLGFKASFSCEEKISYITAGNPDSLYNLGRYNRPSGITSADFFENKMNF